MDKDIVNKVYERSKGLCEVCGNIGEHLHHIIHGNGKRKQCENEHSVMLLCYRCHMGTFGVHGKYGRELDLKLKLRLQELYKKQGYKEADIRKLMGGKIYGTDPGDEH